jgi:hypothetical protein
MTTKGLFNRTNKPLKKGALLQAGGKGGTLSPDVGSMFYSIVIARDQLRVHSRPLTPLFIRLSFPVSFHPHHSPYGITDKNGFGMTQIILG